MGNNHDANCFCGMVDRRKAYLQPGPLSEIITIASLRHAASRIYNNEGKKEENDGIEVCTIHLCWGDILKRPK